MDFSKINIGLLNNREGEKKPIDKVFDITPELEKKLAEIVARKKEAQNDSSVTIEDGKVKLRMPSVNRVTDIKDVHRDVQDVHKKSFGDNYLISCNAAGVARRAIATAVKGYTNMRMNNLDIRKWAGKIPYEGSAHFLVDFMDRSGCPRSANVEVKIACGEAKEPKYFTDNKGTKFEMSHDGFDRMMGEIIDIEDIRKPEENVFTMPGKSLQLNAMKKKADNTVSDDMMNQYIETALWSSTDESTPEGGDHMDENYSIDDVSEKTIVQANKDLNAFVEKAGDLLEGLDMTDVAHDFWLTRNGHGAGFWDKDLGEVGDKLTEISKEFGEVDYYVGNDGYIYGSTDEGELNAMKKKADNPTVNQVLELEEPLLDNAFIQDWHDKGLVVAIEPDKEDVDVKVVSDMVYDLKEELLKLYPDKDYVEIKTFGAEASMKKKAIKVEYIRDDSWDRKIYKGEDGEFYVDVDGVLHTMTDEGEPMAPARDVEVIASIKKKAQEDREFPVGTNVKVSIGSGLASEKSGIIVDRNEVKTDGRGIPTNIEGAYSPVNWNEEVAIQLDDGELITMFKDRVLVEGDTYRPQFASLNKKADDKVKEEDDDTYEKPQEGEKVDDSKYTASIDKKAQELKEGDEVVIEFFDSMTMKNREGGGVVRRIREDNLVEVQVEQPIRKTVTVPIEDVRVHGYFDDTSVEKEGEE